MEIKVIANKESIDGKTSFCPCGIVITLRDSDVTAGTVKVKYYRSGRIDKFKFHCPSCGCGHEHSFAPR